MENEQKYLEWVVRLAISLAIKHLKENQNKINQWPGEQEWHELVGTSQTIFIKIALNEAGIAYDDYISALNSCFESHKELAEHFDNVWKGFEKKEELKANLT